MKLNTSTTKSYPPRLIAAALIGYLCCGRYTLPTNRRDWIVAAMTAVAITFVILVLTAFGA